jgi:hypothetical protein
MIYKIMAAMLITVCLYSCSSAAKETENSLTAIAETNKTVSIMPLKIISDPSSYPGGAVYQGMLNRSFSSFIAYLPGIDVSNAVAPDFTLRGSYCLKGPKSDPRAEITVLISDRKSGESFSNTYSTPTDIEFFDSVDRIIEDIGGFLLKEKTRIAHINFGNFRLGPYDYELRINGRLLSRLASDNFKLSLDVLAGQQYRVELTRLLDSKDFIDDRVTLAPGAGTNYSYRENISYSNDFGGVLSFLSNYIDPGNKIRKVITQNYAGKNSLRRYELMIYHDPDSSANLELSDLAGRNGRKSLHIKGNVSEYISLLLKMDAAGPANASTIRIWAYAPSGFFSPGIVIEDREFKEFTCKYPENLEPGKWTLISIPITNLKFRTDFQPDSSNTNRGIDFPLQKIFFFTANRSNLHPNEKLDVYFDSIEVVD